MQQQSRSSQLQIYFSLPPWLLNQQSPQKKKPRNPLNLGGVRPAEIEPQAKISKYIVESLTGAGRFSTIRNESVDV